MTTSPAAANAGVPRQRLDFVYDSQGRRVSKTVSTSPDGNTWTVAANRRFLYDGWNLIAEYSAPSPTSTNLTHEASYLWGLDLSGTPQGAGGVGGLLAVSLISNNSISNVFPSYDGNGNISAWISASGTLLARMDYSPFGQLVAHHKFTSDATLSRLPFGFSTKYTDPETGLLYYGHRYYDPVHGRWQSRDPVGERGGVNLYGFVGNDGVGRWDFLGLEAFPMLPDTLDEMNASELLRRAAPGEVRIANGMSSGGTRAMYQALFEMVRNRELNEGKVRDFQENTCDCGKLMLRHFRGIVGGGRPANRHTGWWNLREGSLRTRNDDANRLEHHLGYEAQIKFDQFTAGAKGILPKATRLTLSVITTLAPEQGFATMNPTIAKLKGKVEADYGEARINNQDITPPSTVFFNSSPQGQLNPLNISSRFPVSSDAAQQAAGGNQRYVLMTVTGYLQEAGNEEDCKCCTMLYWARAKVFNPM